MQRVIPRACVAAAGVVVALGATTAHAVDPIFADPVILSASNVGTGSSFWGDFNNDGRTEFITSLLSNNLTIYRWDPGTSSIVSKLIEGGGSGHLNRYGGDLVTADVNSDGFLDILAPNSNNAIGPGQVFWYQNPGTVSADPFTDSWTRHTITSWSGSGAQSPDTYVRHMSEIEAGDIDGDGDVDVLTRDVQFGLFLMRNDGNDNWTRRHISANPREGMALHDFDGDGDQDIVINGVWFETPGTPAAPADLTAAAFTRHAYDQNGPIGSENQYPATNDSSTQNQYAKKVKVGDINGDGRADVIVSNAEQLGGANNGGPKGIRVYLAPTDPTNTAGWTELILDEGANVLIPPGETGIGLTDRYGLHNLEIADVDGDGDLDILSATGPVSDGAAPARIFTLLNNGNLTFTFHSIDDVKAYNNVLADFDGDGDLDLFGSEGFGGDGPVRYYENLTPIPEPTTVAMLFGLGVLALGRRSR